MATQLINNVYRRLTLTDKLDLIVVPGQYTLLESTHRDVSMGQTSRITVSNPDWKYKTARGLDATNPYRSSKFVDIKVPSIIASSIQYEGTKPYLIFTTSQRRFGPSPSLIGPMHDATLLGLASNRLKKKLRGKADAFRGMTPTAEFRDLAKAVRSVAKLSMEFLFSYGKAKKQSLKLSARKKEQWLANSWLTYNFGVAPLVRDVSSAVQSMESYLNRSDFPVRLSSAAEKSWTTSGTSDLDTINNMVISSKHQIVHTLSYRITAGFDLKLLSGNNYSMEEHLGLDLKLVPVTLYELTAFSWMLDYFVNIGAYLEDLFYVPPGTTKYVSVMRRYEATCNEQMFSRSISSNTKCGLAKSQMGNWTFFDAERTGLSSLPSTGLRFKMQDEQGFYAVTKLLNMLSILRK